MKLEIRPGKLKGRIEAPPSKSYAHRMLICAAFTEGGCKVDGISRSGDMKATLACISALGAECTHDGTAVTIKQTSGGITRPVFSCGESGSSLRFFIPIALALTGGGVFTGTERLMERGIEVYEEVFDGKAVSFDKQNGRIDIRGRLEAGAYNIRGDVSSQYITGMLFALSLLKEDSVIKVIAPVESRAYIDITIDVMGKCGIRVTEKEPNTFYIKGGQKYKAEYLKVEGDWSNAAFLYAFNETGSELEITGTDADSVQGDKSCPAFFRELDKEGAVIDISDTPDLGPVLFAVAAVKNGGRFTGTKRLRIKESDRAQAMARELKKFGISSEIKDNEVIIHKGTIKKPEQVLSVHNDHRIAMALTIPASLTGAVMENADAVEKSWPDFFTVTEKAGLKIKTVE